MEDDIIKSTFDDWIEYTFVTNPNDFYRREIADEYLRYDWRLNAELNVTYLRRLFDKPVESTQKYNENQIKEGFWLLLAPEASESIFELLNLSVPLELRIQTTQAMYTVFEQLFEPRCSPDITAFQTEEHRNSLNTLNSLCFLWWEIIPFHGKSGQPEREVLDPYCIEVMERTLHLKSIACQEAALHGLGHWAYAYPEKVQPIIDAYLAREKNLPPDLREYALDARKGLVL